MILSKRPEVERFLSHPDSPVAGVAIRAAVIWGRDRGGVRERADTLVRALVDSPDDPFNVAILTDADLDEAGRLSDELAAISMIGGRRLVRLRLTSDRAALDRSVAAAFGAHAAGEYNPDAFFLVEAGALERSSALRKAAEQAKSGAVSLPVYEDEAGDIARMVREALQADRVGLTPEALDVFVARLPKERGVARQEIERLILYLGPGSGATGDAATLVPFLGVQPEASLSDAAADAFGGRAALAHAALRRAQAEGEGGPAAVRALGYHLGRLRRAAVLTDSGATAQEAAKAAGVFWKQEREFVRQLSGWRPRDLDTLAQEVVDADLACKSTGAPDALIAERLYLATAIRARRMGL